MAGKSVPEVDHSIDSLIDSLDQGPEGIRISGLKGSARAYLVSKIYRKTNKNLVIIAPSSRGAERLYDDLSFFLRSDEKKNLSDISRDPEILLYPSWGTLPFQQVSPPLEIIGQRLECLFNLLSQKDSTFLLIIPVKALLTKVIPPQNLLDSIQWIRIGEDLSRDEFLKFLNETGYQRIHIVEDLGDFSLRGGIIDIFTPGYHLPLRLELFGDTVESIRLFDPQNQRSTRELAEAVILPVREVILKKPNTKLAGKRIKLRSNETGYPKAQREEMLDIINRSQYFPGIETLLPFFYQTLATLYEYFPEETTLIFDDYLEIEKVADESWDEIKQNYSKARRRDILVPPPKQLYLSPDALRSNPDNNSRVFLEDLEINPFPQEESCSFFFNTLSHQDIRPSLDPNAPDEIFSPLVRRIWDWQENREKIFFVARSQQGRERLKEILESNRINTRISEATFFQEFNSADRSGVILLEGELSRGFRFPAEKLSIVTEEEIFGERKSRPITRPIKSSFITYFGELKKGDYIVHLEYGIGIYQGLRKLKVGGYENDFLHLEYAGGDRVYIPVDRMKLVQRYMGSDDHTPRVDRLGGSSWEKTKRKVSQSLQEMADELLELYAARSTLSGYAFSPRDNLYMEFEATFDHEETPDQRTAIDEVLGDMETSRPMDRLVCGDVGFGKTEVALRASFRAVMDLKQVALLVPTTILAQQHFHTFHHRLKNYPIVVEVLSRFRSRVEQQRIMKELGEGKIDIIIGTHRLLQKDVVFKDLGLLIIDEEHRFGVAHKEKLKKLRRSVDGLTLTATPIPRTLQLSLLGIRDLSTIITPPPDRQSIRTYIVKFDEELVRTAIGKEIQRGGQVFFVHDRVRSITAVANYLKSLVQEAKVGIAHGQMEEKRLEKVMLDFLQKRINLLVCTTIIGSGLDIPAANTIIINRAERYGLADLYQLRGRVGRSRERAYAYLLIPPSTLLSREAQKRLKALQSLTELSSGFRLALQDLEIRGSGNILGRDQSGHIAAVGLELYTQLLERAIKKLRGEEFPEDIEPEINLSLPALLPDNYIPEASQRLLIYKRLASCTEEEGIGEVREELRDCYGPLPPRVKNLFEVMRIKILLRKLRIKTLDFNGKELTLTFHPSTPISPLKIRRLIEMGRAKMVSNYRISFLPPRKDWEQILADTKKLLQMLTKDDKKLSDSLTY
ncbi:MAG: transcription-repair coupling factor [Deltaproteobacteria bacterium]|nr:MAG: transcription-repair coupling factor [Deltaproteobacteria bacterium]